MASADERANLNLQLADKIVHRVSNILEVDEFDFEAASWKDRAFKFENMATAVVPSSREALEWAVQQETPILTVDDIERGPDSFEIDPQVYAALAELLEGEALDMVQNTARGAGLEAWRKLVRKCNLETDGGSETDFAESHHQSWNNESA